MRSSSPSGNTMWRRSARARSSSRYSNICGVTTVGAGPRICSTSAVVSMWRLSTSSAVSTLRSAPAWIRARVWEANSAVL
ncbi:hypothetical protein C1Y40_05432 [Mycobacterium talmoniae]|uniref:Uncharacterized protein n=1 Tax=Mycobacterium talmoniae TaxID=1858794 RepID=A0A2S8BCN6_9MYCO|nr:hypothetical protein C1Y40_05432 [Mycobacterium talmoniae]